MNRILVIGHRGDQEKFPENTISAFLSAILECRCDAVELDVHRTADEQLVVFHDEWLLKFSGEPVPIKYLSYGELKDISIKVFSRIGYEGLYVPLLEEVFDSLKNSKAFVVVEIKGGEKKYPGITDHVVELIRKKKFTQSVIITSFDLNVVKRLSEVYTNISRGYLPRIFDAEYLEQIADKLSLHSIHLPLKTEALESGKKLADKGIPIYYYVVNDEKSLKMALEHGAKGVFTDYPCKLMKTRLLTSPHEN